MRTSQILKRIIWLPAGLIKGLFELANDKARDIHNNKKFPNAIIEKGVTLTDDTIIGNNTLLCKNVVVNKSKIGNYSYVNHDTLIQNTTIGNYTSIAHGVKMGLGAHPLHLFSTSPVFYKKKNSLKINVIKEDVNFNEYKPIKIGHDVWIGANVIIMDGIKIGNGAVIAAGAIITKNVPPYAIIAGIPGKIIKFRFEEQTINELEKTKWWLKNADEVQNISSILAKITN